MEIVSRKFLKTAAEAYPRAAEALAKWTDIVRDANWESPVDLKHAISNVDPVKVKSGHTVYVCNIRGNEFRLIVAVHFDRQRVFTLRFLTHDEYDQKNWKEDL